MTVTVGEIKITDSAAGRPQLLATILGLASTDGTVSTGASSTGQIRSIELGGTVRKGEIWSVSLSGGVSSTYTIPGNSTSLDTIASNLLSDLNTSPYSVSYNSTTKVLTVVRLDSSSVTATTSVEMPVSTPIDNTSSTLFEPWTHTVSSLDAFVAGDTFELRLTTESGASLASTVKYTVQAGDDNAAVINGLKSILDGLSLSDYTFSVSGSELTISRSDRQAVTVELIHNTAEFPLTKQDDPRKHYNTATIDFSSETVSSGVTWILTIGEKSYSYTPRKNSTVTDAVNSLKSKAQSDGYTITQVSGSATHLSFSGLNGSSIYLQIGSGSLNGLIDVDQYVNAVTGNPMPAGLKVRLLNSTGTAITLTDVTRSSADTGSLVQHDPMYYFSISTADVYTIELYTEDTGTPPQTLGVPAGSIYKLNLSLPGHSVNEKQVNLIGKTMTFTYVDAQSIEQTFTTSITGYDPVTGNYSLEDALPAGVEEGTNFSIGFQIEDIFPEYTNSSDVKGYRTDTYTVVLTQQPADGETVTVTINNKQTRTYNSRFAFTASRGEANNYQTETDLTTLTFTSSNWNIPQTVTVSAVDDDLADGSDAQVFVALDQRVNRIRGPVIVEGGYRIGAEQFLNDPLMLPGETNFPKPDGAISEQSQPVAILRRSPTMRSSTSILPRNNSKPASTPG